MRSLIRFTTMLALVALSSLLSGESKGFAPSMKAGMTREVLSWRQEILPREAYQTLVEEWRAYLNLHPE